MEGQIHIATSGWHYQEWVKKFYPEDMKKKDWLSFYANEFDTTEINSSFYRLPGKTTIEKWVNSVPPDFKFSLKFSRYLTHMKKLNDPEEPFEKFFAVFEPMKKKTGIVLLQLPPQLGFKEEKAKPVFELTKAYQDNDFAVEVRHDSWLKKESIKLMEQYGIAFTISQSGAGWPYAEYFTSKNVYVRFHGPKKLFGSPYPDKMLKDYAKKFKKWAKSGHHIWAYFNNDMHGYAVQNARTLIGMLKP